MHDAITDHLRHIVVFVRVAESHGFTAAARRLGVSTAAVSKSVSLLENQLGVKLLNRTTRSLSLTDDGKLFFFRCRNILADLESAEAAVTRAAAAPRGKLRIHAPVAMGRRVVMPVLLDLTRRYPELSIDADFSDRTPDLAEEGLDATVLIGEPADSRLVARPLARLRYVTCATPEYLAAQGTPQSPDDLARHSCLAYVQWQTGRYHAWEFLKDGRQFTLTPSGMLNVNHAEAILDAVVAGAGIARMASFVAAPAIADGRLRLVLADWVAPVPRVHVMYPQARHVSPRTRAFVKAMAQALPGYLPWEREIGLPPPAA